MMTSFRALGADFLPLVLSPPGWYSYGPSLPVFHGSDPAIFDTECSEVDEVGCLLKYQPARPKAPDMMAKRICLGMSAMHLFDKEHLAYVELGVAASTLLQTALAHITLGGLGGAGVGCAEGTRDAEHGPEGRPSHHHGHVELLTANWGNCCRCEWLDRLSG